jgi:nucleotide-binding universal stress UspA family protein
MFSKVLVPLDGSELAEAVLPYVQAICSRCEPAEIVLFQVLPPPSGQSGFAARPASDDFPSARLPDSAADMETARHPIYRDQVMAAARAEVEECLARAAETLCDAGASVRVDMAFGRPAEEIVDYAEREGIELIVMSTHGGSGLTRWILGSVADKVLHASHLPILLVHPLAVAGTASLPRMDLEL